MPKPIPNIKKIFSDFNKLRVLIIGDVMIDSYVWGKVERISPEAPVPVVTVQKKENRLGGAANVALNVQAMGAIPILCSVIGDEINGNLFTELLKQQGLSSEGIIKSKSRNTTVKTRVIGNNHQLVRVDEETGNDITTKETQLLLQRIMDILNKKKIDVVIFEDYDKGVITATFIDKVIQETQRKNIPVAVDPKKKNFMHYKNVTLMKPNLRELQQGLKLDFEYTNTEALKNAVKTLQKKNNINMALITLSEMGVLLSVGSVQKLIPAHIRNIADVSGAGDTVISIAALCLALNLSPEFIATLSNLAGGLVCEKVGVVPVDKEQLLQEAISIG